MIFFDMLNVLRMGTVVIFLDPMEIVSGAGGEDVVEDGIVEILQLNNLFYLLKENAVILASIMLLILFISMYFVRESQKLADKKADILHKLSIVFLIFSILWILSVFITVLDSIF